MCNKQQMVNKQTMCNIKLIIYPLMPSTIFTYLCANLHMFVRSELGRMFIQVLVMLNFNEISVDGNEPD